MTLIKSISGIRGTIGGEAGQNLTPPDVVKFVSAYGAWMRANEQLPKKVVVGRDARISGSLIGQLVTATLCSMGIDVVDIGLATTPTVAMAVPEVQAGGGIIVTASHNPANWNALKLLNAEGEFLDDANSKRVVELAEAGNFVYATNQKLGKIYPDTTQLDTHIEKILALPLVDTQAIAAKGFRILVDGVNSVGGFAVPKLLEALGVHDVQVIYGEPTGKFAHNPEPLPEHLTELCHKMEVGNYHLGIAVDPDVDRLAFVSEDGTPFGEEYTLVAVSHYVLTHTAGNTVSNLSSTRALRDVTEKAGGTHYASLVGEANVVVKMKECQAIIGGEGNGGVIYPPLHYGRDALVGIALFLSHLAHFKGTAKMLRKTYPDYYIAKNKIELTPEIDVDHVLEKMKERYQNMPINTEDGVKIEFEQEWVHLRKSNTEPIIRIYSESDSLSTSEHLANKIIEDIKEIIAFRAEE